ncbi:hypothetical protein EVAR_74623_1 [Eumeta japonica]|uniref:Uncharacterized protein n=1 Tax=Eumeta variegata TaxID=151549 RepID=A0A4C1W9Q5_EUMVA|nr:hypothetical protein EVAR_74623_1 [Eumeta japonica]
MNPYHPRRGFAHSCDSSFAFGFHVSSTNYYKDGPNLCSSEFSSILNPCSLSISNSTPAHFSNVHPNLSRDSISYLLSFLVSVPLNADVALGSDPGLNFTCTLGSDSGLACYYARGTALFSNSTLTLSSDLGLALSLEFNSIFRKVMFLRISRFHSCFHQF